MWGQIRVTAGWGSTTIVWPDIQTYAHSQTGWSRWEDVRRGKHRTPPSLFYYPHCKGQLGGRHSFFSAFRGKQKSVWGPLLHARACVQTHTTHPTKKLSVQLWADHISAAWACQQAAAAAWVLSLGHLLKVKVREIISTLLTRASMLTCSSLQPKSPIRGQWQENVVLFMCISL